VPPFDKYIDELFLPAEAFDAVALRTAIGTEKIEDTPFAKVVASEVNERGGKPPPPWGTILNVDSKTRTVVVTKFSPDQYEEFLIENSGLPWDKLQAIKVVAEN